MDILAQILGVLGLISLLVSLVYTKKDITVKSQVLSNVLFASQYLCLNAIPGMIASIISAIRYLVSGIYLKKNKKVPVIIIFLFVACIIIPIIFLNYGIMGIFPLIATLIYTIGIFLNNTKLLRIITLITSSLFIGYNVFVKAYPSLIGNILELLISFVAIYKFDINDKN